MELRAGVIRHMRKKAAYYKQFIDVRPTGWGPKHPKPKFTDTPTAAQINQAFESHLQKMARGGTYGDNMELSAFSEAFNVDIRIYQRDLTYLVSTKPEGKVLPVLHIAYHVRELSENPIDSVTDNEQAWEHYSSVRNIHGPHNGPPRITPTSTPASNGGRNRRKRKMEVLSDQSGTKINPPPFKLKDTKQLQASAFGDGKQRVARDDRVVLPGNYLKAGRRERKKRRRLINRAERDRLSGEQQTESKTPRGLREVCI